MSNDKDMHRAAGVAGKVLKTAVPIAVSAGLVAWLFHKVDFRQVMQIVSEGVDYRYIAVMMLLTVLSQVIRGIRWGIQLRAVGIPRMPVTAECVSIFGAYALNLIFQYLGEAWRCVYVSRRQNARLSTVVGTDIGDRASDGVMIGLLILVAMYGAGPYLDRFMDNYPLGKDIQHYLTDGTVWAWALGAIAALAIAARIWRHTPFMQGVWKSASRIAAGFASLIHLKGDTWLYIVMTLGIWACYFLETYSCFWAFPFTRELTSHPGYAMGLLPGLVVFVFGACSMAVPSSGGLGAWNLAVMFALSLFGVGESDGAAYSVVCWGFQAATYIALGIFSAVYIMCSRHKKPRQPAAAG